jgi:hypothetical protein
MCTEYRDKCCPTASLKIAVGSGFKSALLPIFDQSLALMFIYCRYKSIAIKLNIYTTLHTHILEIGYLVFR